MRFAESSAFDARLTAIDELLDERLRGGRRVRKRRRASDCTSQRSRTWFPAPTSVNGGSLRRGENRITLIQRFGFSEFSPPG